MVTGTQCVTRDNSQKVNNANLCAELWHEYNSNHSRKALFKLGNLTKYLKRLSILEHAAAEFQTKITVIFRELKRE